MIGIKNHYLFDAFKPNLTKAFQSYSKLFKNILVQLLIYKLRAFKDHSNYPPHNKDTITK